MKPCSFDPTVYAGQPIGMFHCPECGEMVVAGLPHPGDPNLNGLLVAVREYVEVTIANHRDCPRCGGTLPFHFEGCNFKKLVDAFEKFIFSKVNND